MARSSNEMQTWFGTQVNTSVGFAEDFLLAPSDDALALEKIQANTEALVSEPGFLQLSYLLVEDLSSFKSPFLFERMWVYNS